MNESLYLIVSPESTRFSLYPNQDLVMIPSDSRVEIDAKINAGYFTTGHICSEEELKNIEGRGWANWEDVAH